MLFLQKIQPCRTTQINDAGIDSECKFILDLFLFKNFTGNESVLVKTQVHFFSNMITGIFLEFKIMPYAASLRDN